MGESTQMEDLMPFRNVASCAFLALSLVGVSLGDTLTLKDGRTIYGAYLGGNSRQIRMEVGDNIQTFEIEGVASIQFGSGATAAAQAPSRNETSTSAARSGMELPTGTALTVRM